jgi:hypothetical protein
MLAIPLCVLAVKIGKMAKALKFLSRCIDTKLSVGLMSGQLTRLGNLLYYYIKRVYPDTPGERD